MGDHANDQLASRRHVLKTTALTGATVLLGGLTSTGQVAASTVDQDSGIHADSSGVARDRANDVEIVAKHDHRADEHRFELSTQKIAAGWTTLTFDNQTNHTHMVNVYRFPQPAIEAANEEDAQLRDFWHENVAGPFQYLMDTLVPEKEPNPDDLSDRYSDLEGGVLFPEWSLPAQGGVGLTAGHATSRTTVELAPGEYLVECYVKNEDNEFHSYRGMAEHFTVTDGQTGAAPKATLDLALSTEGIDAPENVQAGQQTVAVEFENQQIYDHFVGHDVHLIRFDHSTTTADVNGWMNWMDPDQFISDGTEPGTFLGGAEAVVTPELTEGQTTVTEYVHVNLNPGAYAWVAEVPSPADKNMLKPFIVPFEKRGG